MAGRVAAVTAAAACAPAYNFCLRCQACLLKQLPCCTCCQYARTPGCVHKLCISASLCCTAALRFCVSCRWATSGWLAAPLRTSREASGPAQWPWSARSLCSSAAASQTTLRTASLGAAAQRRSRPLRRLRMRTSSSLSCRRATTRWSGTEAHCYQVSTAESLAAMTETGQSANVALAEGCCQVGSTAASSVAAA